MTDKIDVKDNEAMAVFLKESIADIMRFITIKSDSTNNPTHTVCNILCNITANFICDVSLNPIHLWGEFKKNIEKVMQDRMMQDKNRENTQ